MRRDETRLESFRPDARIASSDPGTSSSTLRRDRQPFIPREGAALSPLLFTLCALSVSMFSIAGEAPFFVAALLAPLAVWGLSLLFSEYRPFRFFSYIAVLSLLAFLAALYCGYRTTRPATPPSGLVQEEGRVTLERPWGARCALLVETPSRRFMMKVSQESGVSEGDMIAFSGRARAIASFRGSSFREDLFWRARGASLEVVPETISRRDGGWSLARWRTFLRNRILLALPPRTSGYLLAALLGIRDPELTESHRRWGTSHLLAVSGFHVGLVALGFWKLLGTRRMRLLLSRRVAVLLTSLVLWLYALLAGGAPGALRAALMIQTLLLGKLLGRKGTPLNSVSLAALLLLLWRPEWFFDVGWRLSVMAALLLSALADRFSTFSMLCISSVFIWLATFPQVAAIFGEVPVAGLLLNLAALPLFSFFYPLAFLMSLPLLLDLPFGNLIAAIPEAVFFLWELVADFGAALLPWNLPWSPFFAFLGGAVFILTVCCGLFPLRGRTVAGAGIFFTAIMLLL